MPTSTFDTFFACTIIVAAALIATGYICSTMQVRIDNTKNINEQSYLQAIADHIVTNPGSPSNWGSSDGVPSDFGLAASSATTPYELDGDKVSRLNNLNNYSLSYFDVEKASELDNIALGIEISQIMNVAITQSTNVTMDGNTFFTLTISTTVDSEPVSANVNCYAVTNGFIRNATTNTSDDGVGQVTVQIPTSSVANALCVVFARASFDDRITSYGVYNLTDATLETVPSNDPVILSPLDYTLSLIVNSSAITVQNCNVFSYAHQQSLSYVSGVQGYDIPDIVDKSPLILVVDGFDNGTYFQEWIPYPEVPFTAGSNFAGNAQNVFSYEVTINGVLYRLEISLGGPSS